MYVKPSGFTFVRKWKYTYVMYHSPFQSDAFLERDFQVDTANDFA
jgi:hypothetical protein